MRHAYRLCIKIKRTYLKTSAVSQAKKKTKHRLSLMFARVTRKTALRMGGQRGVGGRKVNCIVMQRTEAEEAKEKIVSQRKCKRAESWQHDPANNINNF